MTGISRITLSKPYVGFKPLSNYNPQKAYGFGTDRTGDVFWHWQIIRQDDYGTVDVPIRLQGDLTDTETLTWTFSGSAVEGTDFNCPISSITVRPGVYEHSIPIQIINKGKFFSEKDVILTLQSSSGLIVEKDHDQARVVIHPATAPPKLTLALSGSTFATTGDTITATVTSHYAVYEDTSVYLKFTGPAGSEDFVSSLSAPVGTISAGTSSVGITVTYTATGSPTSGNTATVNIDHERDTVKFSELDFDMDTESFSRSRDVHVDENMWVFSNDVNYRGHDVLTNRTADKPWWVGWPTPHSNDGATEIANYGDDGNMARSTIESQTIASPHVDPVTGNELKYFVPNSNIQSGIPYIRCGFETTWAGGRSTAHTLKEWVRGSYRVVPMTGADASKNVDYFGISLRVRTQDLNHEAIFAWQDTTIGFGQSLTPGTAADGSTGHPVFTAANGTTKIWVWRFNRPHPDAVDPDLDAGWGTWYGAFEDDHGLGVYVIHKVDSAVSWQYVKGDGTTETRTETAGVDKGNHIHTPTGRDHNLDDVRDNLRGMLFHSVSTEMSETALSGPPDDFWPNMAWHWHPRGGAVVHEGETYTAGVSLT